MPSKAPFCLLQLAVLSLLLMSCRTGARYRSQESGESVSAAVTFTPNDVSILFPLDQNADFFPVLVKSTDIPDPATYAPGEPAAAADGQAFLPLDLLTFLRRQRLTGAGAPLLEEKDLAEREVTGFYKMFLPPAAARLVAIRIDPCPTIRLISGDKSQCHPQLRLIWQPFFDRRPSDPPETAVVADANVHAAYSLEADEFKAVLATIKRELVAAGSDRDLSPKLAPNPLMRKQGPSGGFTKAVIGIVHRYARRQKLVALSGMTVSDFRFPTWNMTAARIVSGQATMTSVINAKPGRLNNKDATFFASQFIGNINGLSELNPEPASVDTYAPLTFLSDSSNAASAPADPKAYASNNLAHLYNVINPTKHDVFDLDCSSCHLAVHGLNKAADNNVELPNPNAVFKSKWDLDTKAVQAATNSKNNLHMFSYFSDFQNKPPTATIQPRVINETALVVDFINDNYP